MTPDDLDDVILVNPPPRPERTIQCRFEYVGRDKPLPMEEEIMQPDVETLLKENAIDDGISAQVASNFVLSVSGSWQRRLSYEGCNPYRPPMITPAAEGGVALLWKHAGRSILVVTRIGDAESVWVLMDGAGRQPRAREMYISMAIEEVLSLLSIADSSGAGDEAEEDE